MKRSPMKRGTKLMKRGKRVNPISERRQRENKVRREVLATHLKTYCEAQRAGAPGECHGQCHGHEIVPRGRGGSITDPTNIKTVCDGHNTAISQDPKTMAWAYEHGFLKHADEGRNT